MKATPPPPAPARSYLIWQKDGALLDLAVIPNARRTECVGLHDGALRVRLAAPPVDGAANEALVRWAAQELALPRACVSLVRGASSRRKRLHLAAEAVVIERWARQLDALLAAAGDAAAD